ncbi:MAG TPA: enolase C-terminal domain-like protein [Thermoanaerobaculia bacterium]
MDLWYWRYTLTPRTRLSAVARPGPREGALLRVGDGYADVHPWPELGDLPLDEQLARLARGATTRLTSASLVCAELDGQARVAGRSLFAGLTIPLSHWTGEDAPDAFDTVKLKGIPASWPDKRLRLDFNATLTAEEFVRIAETLPHERIDFVEDPCPYDPAVWRALRERTGLRLALDRETATDAVDLLVVKPALGGQWMEGVEMVVTTYFDHPIGQFYAAYVAATNQVSARNGLFTHVAYEANAFSERITADGARLLPPEGTGLGFDDLLRSLPWKRLG